MTIQIGRRLAFARKRLGLSLKALAEEVSLNTGASIAAQLINTYEKGTAVPSEKVFPELLKALKIDEDFLFKAPDVAIEKIDFRKTYRITKSKKDILEAKIQEIIEFVASKNEYKNKFKIKYSNDPLQNEAMILKAVEHFKKELNLNLEDPVKSTIKAAWDLNLNTWNIKPDREETSLPDNVFGFNAEYHLKTHDDENNKVKNNIIIINDNSDISLERKRFTLMHEIAHGVLELDDSNDDFSEKYAEKICNLFASEFLIPSQQVHEFFKKNAINKNTIIEFKKIYGISGSAVIYKLKQLDIINENAARWMYMSFAKTWRKNEPDAISSEDWEIKPEKMIQLAQESFENNKIDKAFLELIT